MSTRLTVRMLGGAIAALAMVAAPASLNAAFAAASKTQAAEHNPPGDIPDDQVFVTYRSPLGFTMKTPEGWSRADRPGGARFSDKYNVIDIAVADAAAEPKASANDLHVAELSASGRAVKIANVKAVKIEGGPAVRIVYSVQSEPNAVTNKSIPLEGSRYLFWKAGKLATLDLQAPAGADNVDVWRLISRSFRWN